MSKVQNLLALVLASLSLLSAPAVLANETAKGVAPSPVVADPQSPFLAVQVALDGTFNMGVNPTAPPCGGGPTFPMPCEYNISFQWPGSPGTGFTTVRVDGADHAYGGSGLTQPPTDSADGLSNASAEDVANIHTMQQLTIVPGQTGNLDTARIRYVVTNMDSVPHQVGVRVMIDTMLNNNDGAPFRVEGMPITTETDFVGAAVPSFWDAFFNLAIPRISARGTLIGGGATPPDRFVIAGWGNIVGTLFDFTVTPGAAVTGDSAVAIYWNPVQLAPGESRLFDTFYGASSAVGGASLLVTAPHNLAVVPGSTAGTLEWSPNPFMVVAFFTSSPGGAILDVDMDLDLAGASSLSLSSPNPQHFAGVRPGQTVSATWMVEASAPGDEQYALRVLASPSATVLAQQQIETVIPELLVPPVTNPINPGPIHLQADGLFCADASMPCATPFPSPGNIGGLPIPQAFEWKGTVPLAFVPGSAGATPGLLTDHGVRAFVYAAVDTEPGATGQINFYLNYDFLQSALVPFVPGQVFSVQFDVNAGRFAGRMVVSLHCAEGLVLVSGFDNGMPFVDRPADALGIKGACGGGTSPNPTGDPFFDVFTDIGGVTQGFNVSHPIIELEIPLTKNLGGAPNPAGGVYDPSPAFWGASAPDPAGDPVLSNNMVAIDAMNGSTALIPVSATAVTTTTLASTSTTTTAPPTTTTSSTTTTTSTTTSSTTLPPTTTTTVPANRPPNCSAAAATSAMLWPPNHKLMTVAVAGVTDPDGDPVSISITGVTQDEPVGTPCPDATGVGTASASLRAERLGNGDGRVYHVSFDADDARGGHCGGTVMVCVPHDQQPGHVCMDQGALFDSTVCP